MTATGAAVSAFRESYLAARPGDQTTVDPWSDWTARRSRYALYWALSQNDVYRQIHSWSTSYKSAYGLYRHTRGVYNPAARIVGFYRAHLMGGALDGEAGDGTTSPNAIPITGADAALRSSIAKLWWDSNWQTRKDVFTAWGTTFGDVALRVADDPEAGLVSLEIVHPGTIRWLRTDPRGEVTAYVLEDLRLDPMQADPVNNPNAIDPKRTVRYVETAEIVGADVVYRTYKDGVLFDWRAGPDGRPMGTGRNAQPEWTVPYGFIPLFPVRHLDIGSPWGMSELETGRVKIDEVNDLGSKLHDQIRRAVEGAWLMAGMQKPKDEPTYTDDTRTQVKALYAPSDSARPWSLVGDVNIEATSAEIRQALDNLEDDYPELRFERLRTGGQVSGEALRVARQPAAARVEERRAGYDYALTMAQMAAVAIGGWRGYEGYQGFGLESYSNARPTHRIGSRPVFAQDPIDVLTEKTARYNAVRAATQAGIPLEIAMAEAEFAADVIAQAVAAREREANQQAARDRTQPPDQRTA
jgi:hypothetical protein